jgi:hypothetical protein
VLEPAGVLGAVMARGLQKQSSDEGGVLGARLEHDALLLMTWLFTLTVPCLLEVLLLLCELLLLLCERLLPLLP